MPYAVHASNDLNEMDPVNLRLSACPVESTKWQGSVFNWGVL